MSTLGPNMMAEMFRRLTSIGHPFCAAYLREVSSQYGYCLDAPDELPGGGLEWSSDPRLPFLDGAQERMVLRESVNPHT